MERYTWVRVNRHMRCPICGRADWCRVSPQPDRQGNKVIECPRTPNAFPVHSPEGEFVGYLHRIPIAGGYVPLPAWRTIPDPPKLGSKEIQAVAWASQLSLDQDRLSRFADGLGLTVGSLKRLRIGWHRVKMCWTFPMVGIPFSLESVVGVRTRFDAGDEKRSIFGGASGLFVPAGLIGRGPLLIEEGPTSVAALLDLGYEAIGRPNCSGGVALILAYIRRNPQRPVILIANNDKAKKRPNGSIFYPGQEGGLRLADTIAATGQPVKLIVPPNWKDSRDWKNKGGANKALIDSIIRGHYYHQKDAA